MFDWLKSCQSVYLYGSDLLTSLPMYIAMLTALNLAVTVPYLQLCFYHSLAHETMSPCDFNL